MKKFTSLQCMMLMSLALGSSLVTPVHAKAETIKKDQVSHDSMKKIEKDLKRIRQEFKKSNNRQKALQELKKIETRVKAFIKHLKVSEKHGSMWEVHEHTLNRKLKEARECINKHSQE